MPIEIEKIPANEVPDRLYFSFHTDKGGVVTLYTPDGVYNLSEDAVEVLMTNFLVNIEALKAYINRRA